MTNIIQKSWHFIQQANHYWQTKTQPIRGESLADKLPALKRYFGLDDEDYQTLQNVAKEDEGEDFLLRKVDDVNRYASHRTALLLNAAAQFVLVNLSSIKLLGFIPALWFKVLLVGANLVLAWLAWRRVRTSKKQILEGPSKEPEWSFWGMFRSNRRKHNQHIKDLAEPFKIRMKDERLFMIMYAVNAITIFFGSQLILTGYLPSVISWILNIPLFIVSIPLVLANAYWAFTANNQIIKAATERGKRLDKLKL